jgi:hypothetical protein
MTCSPIGNPLLFLPAGTDAAGKPTIVIKYVFAIQSIYVSNFLPLISEMKFKSAEKGDTGAQGVIKIRLK